MSPNTNATNSVMSYTTTANTSVTA
jgi:hypothetical protein